MTISLYLNGGLGNQLFNYAAARTIADRTDTDLVIDLSSYRPPWNITRPFMLDMFPVRSRYRNVDGIIEKHSFLRRVHRYLREDFLATKVLRNSGEIEYFDRFKRLGSRTILQGDYISWKFFEDNSNNIRNDLCIDSAIRNLVISSSTASSIISLNSVGVHVRRGDLLHPHNAWRMMGNQQGYYENTMHMIQDMYPDAEFFVFSDDIDWCRNAFADSKHNIHFINTPGEGRDRTFVDFCLMSACRHHIIANSGFSWWAAWLGHGQDQVVLCPDKWDKDNIENIDDITHPNWIKVAA